MIASGTAPAPRVSRVLLAYRAENFDRAVHDLARALGIRFEMLELAHIGLRIAMSLESGVEVVTAIGEAGHGPAIRAAIEAKGEGLQQFILAVPDLEAAAERAAREGWDSGGVRIDCFATHPGWRAVYSTMNEAPLPPIHGASVTLIELKDAR